MIVNLPQEDWSRVLAILAQAPWNTVNTLILSIGDQLRHQAAQGTNADLAAAMNQAGMRPNGADRRA